MKSGVKWGSGSELLTHIFIDVPERRSGVRAQWEDDMRLFKDDVETIDKVQRALKQIVQQVLSDHLLAARKSDRIAADRLETHESSSLSGQTTEHSHPTAKQ
jgi:hypothetical protein